MNLISIILAAGQGTRMRSSLPKVLHTVGGKPMLLHVIEACRSVDSSNIVIVYGHGGDMVQQTISTMTTVDDLSWAEQKEQKGTGHAVLQAEKYMDDDAIVVIAYGDVPLIKAETLKSLADTLKQGSDMAVLTTLFDDPSGYGRIIRDKQGLVERIVEEKDANNEQRRIKEVNTGFLAAKGKDLKRWLHQINPDNAQAEYYLTDCVSLAVNEGGKVDAVVCEDSIEVKGVNNRKQQAELERAYQNSQAEALMQAGVTLLDPNRIDVRGSLRVGKDVLIDVNAVFTGNVTLGNNVCIEAGCVIHNSHIADNVTIKAHSVLESATIGENCDVGPFARIRPETVLKANAKVGNFVEIKKSTIGKNSKVSHLSYIGDTQMDEAVNIGAGTITCNYDGANKFQTTIGNNVFVGSDTQLVAPVHVKEGATIGAGSTITKDAPENELTLSRSKQVTIKGWQRPVKGENKKN